MLFFALVALLATSSCKQNTAPEYEEATEFVLNRPAMAEQYYQLTPDGVFDLDWSQPNWGFAAAAQYTIQASLSEDFATSVAAEAPAVFNLGDPVKSCKVTVKMEDLATAICTLKGYKTEDDYVDEPAGAVYLRVVGNVPQIFNSEVVSNVIKLDQVKTYCAIQSPGKIYLVGAPEGWKGPDAAAAAHYADWALYEADDAIGSKIYYGTFEIPAGNAMFRFYTALTGWDADSYGSQVDDNPLDFEFVDGEFATTLVKGKGSFNFPNWPGGKMSITVDMNDLRVVMKAVN